jgi:uncharacterized phage infection (PIP) family protein YhgE
MDNLEQEVQETLRQQGLLDEEETKESVENLESSDEEEIQLSEVEQEAVSKGWQPNGPKSAEEFLRAGPLYDEIKARGKEIKELKSTLDELKKHMDKQQQLGYEQAINELKQKRVDAIEMGDVNEVDDIDRQISEYNQQVNTSTANPASPEAEAFLEKHKDWINDTSQEAMDMKNYAHIRDQELMKYNLSPARHLERLENDLKQMFPNRFKDERSAKPVSVESDAAPTVSASRRKHTFSDLNAEQKKAARHFEQSGIMSINEYIKDLEKLGELK